MAKGAREALRSSSSSVMSPSQTVSNLLGPLALGILLASIVFGINCLQVYLYCTRFSQRDPAALKVYVAALMATDCAHVVLSAFIYYHYTVDCFEDQHALERVYWPVLIQVLVGSALGTMVRQFFVYRIYRLCGRHRVIISMIISMSSIFALASSIAYSVIGTNHAIHLIVMYALNTCILNTYDVSQCALTLKLTSPQRSTRVLALATLVTFIVYTQTTIYTAFWFLLIRVYTCSMLSTLNSRENIRQVLDSQDLLSFPSMELRRKKGPDSMIPNWSLPQDAGGTSCPSSQ
ncbi:hypothetical protein C8Q72DRAFT_912676 [Fomitopsis betulina]|nr:hypothetical protein C8Q72DRAFT_912676 [Fomitopsis betulina]